MAGACTTCTAMCGNGAWIDPAAKDSEAEEEQSRLLRGGSWGNRPGSCRSAYRSYDLPDGRNFCIGFRVCCLPQD